MLPYEVYKVAHLVGLAVLFAALGGLLFAARDVDGKPPRALLVLHGVGVVLMLVGGFGLLARNGIQWPWPNWVLVKAGLWVVLAAMPWPIRKFGLGGAWIALVLAASVGVAVVMVRQRIP